jgi:hypothetical protein
MTPVPLELRTGVRTCGRGGLRLERLQIGATAGTKPLTHARVLIAALGPSDPFFSALRRAIQANGARR